MRDVLRVCYPFVGDTVGGSHISCSALIESLRERGVEPVVVLHDEGELATYLNNRKIRFIRAPDVQIVQNGSIPYQVIASLRCALPLSSFLSRQRIDLIHTNDARMHASWMVAARLSGVRHVWHQRTRSLRLGVYARSSDAILTISEYCRRGLGADTSGRAIVLDNPFDTSSSPPSRDAARSSLLNELAAPSDVLLVGFVGNIMTQKRPQIFVEMAHRLRKRIDAPIRFVMVGERRQEEDDVVSSLIERLELSDLCVRLGQRYPIEPILAGLDVLVAPAIGESFGRVLVEAMLVGTPVVAVNDGGHREIIKDGVTGVLVPVDNPDSLANAVETLLLDPMRRFQMAECAAAAARARFSVERHASAVLSVYRDLVPAFRHE